MSAEDVHHLRAALTALEREHVETTGELVRVRALLVEAYVKDCGAFAYEGGEPKKRCRFCGKDALRYDHQPWCKWLEIEAAAKAAGA